MANKPSQPSLLFCQTTLKTQTNPELWWTLFSKNREEMSTMSEKYGLKCHMCIPTNLSGTIYSIWELKPGQGSIFNLKNTWERFAPGAIHYFQPINEDLAQLSFNKKW